MFANTKTKSKQEQLATTKTYSNEMIMIDSKGPINPKSEGNVYIFVIVDAFSHYVTIMCAPKNNAYYAFTALLEHWSMRFGLPEEIRSDNGSEYINTELTHLCNYFEIKLKPSTIYAPWTNGLVEGTNRIIGQFIRTLLNEKYKNWSKLFPYAYITQYQRRSGMSSYEGIFNQKPRKPTKIKQQQMRWETANQQKEVHVIHTQHIFISRNSLVNQRLQNYRKEHLQNGS